MWLFTMCNRKSEHGDLRCGEATVKACLWRFSEVCLNCCLQVNKNLHVLRGLVSDIN